MENVVLLRKDSPRKCRESIEEFLKTLKEVSTAVDENVQAGDALDFPAVTTAAKTAKKVLDELLVPALEQLIGKEDDGEDSGRASMYTCAATLDRMVKETGVTE